MHLHYSPFQHATAVEVSTGEVDAKKVVKTLKKLTAKDRSKTHDMHSTMSCEAAAMIPGSPNAFISPNAPGIMKDIHMVMSPTDKGMAPKGHSAYDPTYRSRTRLGYGDRMEKMEERIMKSEKL